MSKKKKIPPITYLGIAGVILGTGYVGSKTVSSTIEHSSDSTENNQISILGDTFSGYSTFRNRNFRNQIANANIEIDYRNEVDQSARAEALKQNNADIILTTLDQFLLHQTQGTIVGVIDKTIGADAIVLNTKQYPNLRSLSDLSKLENETSRLVYSADTPSEYLAKVLDIKFEEFSLGNFEVAEVVSSADAYDQLKTNRDVAIAILREPFVSQAKQDGNTIILSSKDVPNSIVNVIVASDTMLQQPQKLSAFLTKYYQHTDRLIQNSATMNRQIAEDGKISIQDASSITSGIEVFSSIESNKWMTDGTLAQRIDATAGILNLTGDLAAFPKNSNQLFNPKYIAQAVKESEQIITSIEQGEPELAQIIKGENPDPPPSQTKEQIQSASNVGNLSVRGEVSFTRGSVILTPASEQTLNQLANDLQDFNQDTTAINIVGHTSQIGPAALNQSLSQQRAQVVANYLKEKGVKLQIVAEGKGFSTPLPNIPPESSQNQRTEIQLKKIR